MKNIIKNLTIISFLYLQFCISGVNDYRNRANEVFLKIQMKTGFWNANLYISESKKTLEVDRSNSIFISDKIINLCYDNRSLDSGDDRLAFILSHELAHISNKDFDYDRFLNPYNIGLKDESLELRQQKEMTADLSAIFIVLCSGFSLDEIANTKDNIITDIYKLYGIANPSKPIPGYLSAVDRGKRILDKISDFTKFLNLYEYGILALITSEGNKIDDLSLISAADAFETFQTHFSYQTPEIYNNCGVAYYNLAKAYYKKYIHNMDEKDINKFALFESNAIINSNLSFGRPKKTDIERSSDLNDYLKFKGYYNKALSSFRESINLADTCFVPARLNMVSISCLNQQFEDAEFELKNIERKFLSEIKKNNLLAQYYNICGIVSFLNSSPKSSIENFKNAIKSDSNFLPAFYNMAIVKKDTNIFKAKSKNVKLPGNEEYEKQLSITIKLLKDKSDKYPLSISFGPKERFALKYANNSDFDLIVLDPKKDYLPVSYYKVQGNDIDVLNIKTGDSIEKVIQKFGKPIRYITANALNYLYYSKPGMIFLVNQKNIIENIIIVENKY